ncbi:hypothetical protein BKA70DRAFT_1396094 [Coprinopsis sp. MPI-PUGE-AT-0042]|nr:hypothetical protein BKA70DRAFT_1396094 [Coprinopsis sp. MPI-PUGE-AT-0042]
MSTYPFEIFSVIFDFARQDPRSLANSALASSHLRDASHAVLFHHVLLHDAQRRTERFLDLLEGSKRVLSFIRSIQIQSRSPDRWVMGQPHEEALYSILKTIPADNIQRFAFYPGHGTVSLRLLGAASRLCRSSRVGTLILQSVSPSFAIVGCASSNLKDLVLADATSRASDFENNASDPRRSPVVLESLSLSLSSAKSPDVIGNLLDIPSDSLDLSQLRILNLTTTKAVKGTTGGAETFYRCAISTRKILSRCRRSLHSLEVRIGESLGPPSEDNTLGVGDLPELRTLRVIFEYYEGAQHSSMVWLLDNLKPKSGSGSRVEEILIHIRSSTFERGQNETWMKLASLLADKIQYPCLRLVTFEFGGFDYLVFLDIVDNLEATMSDLVATGMLRLSRYLCLEKYQREMTKRLRIFRWSTLSDSTSSESVWVVCDMYGLSDMRSLKNFSLATGSIIIHEALEAYRPAQVLERNEDLAKNILTIWFVPNGPPYSDYEDDEHVQWEPGENPFEHPSLLGLLSAITSVKGVQISGGSDNSKSYTPVWDQDALDKWIKFLSHPSIAELSFSHMSVPVDLIGRAPNLKRLRLDGIRVPWPNQAVGAFPKLEQLDIQQTDGMGVGFSNLMKVISLKEKIKSTTFQSLKLDGRRSRYDQDHCAWLDTLSMLTAFGSNTLTTLSLSFFFGFLEADPFLNHWHDRSKEIGGYIAQLRCLETLRFTFSIYGTMAQPSDLKWQGATALEPYLSIVLDSLVRGKKDTNSPFKRLSIDMKAAGYLSTWDCDASSMALDLPSFEVFCQAFIGAPVWRKVDKWLAEDLLMPESTPHLRVAFDFDQTPLVDFEESLLEPLRAQMPQLRKWNAVTALLCSRWDMQM